MKKNSYRQLAEIEDEHWWFVYRRKIVQELLSKVRLRNGIKGLDVACGAGGNVQLLKKYCESVIGLDFSELALEFARNKREIGNVEFVRGDANNLEKIFRQGSFGLITIFNVLYHKWIVEELDVLEQCNVLLESGGIIVLTEPAFGFLMRRHDIQAMGVRRYNLRSAEKLLRNAGFRLIFGTYFNAIGFLPVLFLAVIERMKSKKSKTSINDKPIGELKVPNKPISSLILVLTMLEGSILSRLSKLPFGVTLLCIAEKRY